MSIPRIALVCTLTLAPKLSADMLCAGGNLSTVVNTTCTIGSIQFQFGNLISNFDVESPLGNAIQQSAPWTAANFDFTPVGNGFSLKFLPGALTVAGIPNGSTGEYAQLPFTATYLGNGFISGVNISGGGVTVTGNDYNAIGEFRLSVGGPGGCCFAEAIREVSDEF